ncbi:hypothetical protein, partial [Herbaspirillum sp. B65]
ITFLQRQTCQLDLRHEEPSRPKKGICTFCQNEGPCQLTPLSDEHMFGKWLRKAFPPTTNKHREMRERPEDYNNPNSRSHIRDIVKDQHPYDVQVPHICERCNGWLGQYQEDAKLVITKIATGSWPELSDEECRILARWATMVSINIAKHVHLGFFTEKQLRQLMKGDVPEGFQVSIARIAPTGGRLSGAHLQHPVELMNMSFDDHPVALELTFFCIEEVAFLVTHIAANDSLLKSAQKYNRGIGVLPRIIHPINTASTNTANQWVTKSSLQNWGLEWACQLSAIPVHFF